MEIPQAQKTKT
jgi:hypothetical protein